MTYLLFLEHSKKKHLVLLKITCESDTKALTLAAERYGAEVRIREIYPLHDAIAFEPICAIGVNHD